jgi:hypothetical protein
MSAWGTRPFGAPPPKEPEAGDTVIYYAPDGAPALAVIQAVNADGTLRLGVFTTIDHCSSWASPPAG